MPLASGSMIVACWSQTSLTHTHTFSMPRSGELEACPSSWPVYGQGTHRYENGTGVETATEKVPWTL